MAAARLAALVLAVLFTTLEAQQARQVTVSLKVADQAGAVISGARIEIDPSTGKAEAEVTTDSNGEAVLNLSPGIHVITVTSRGFYKWAQQIEMQDDPGQAFSIKMDVDCGHMICDPLVISADPEIPLDHPSLNVYLPLDPLEAPVFIRTANGSRAARDTKAQLERLLAQFDLSRWAFCHEVLIDKMPAREDTLALKIPSAHNYRENELLNIYLQAQLDRYLTNNFAATHAAEQDLRKLYPTLQSKYPKENIEAALLLCFLELQASRALGEPLAAEVANAWTGGRREWIYRTVLKDEPQIESILKQRNLDNPDARIAESGGRPISHHP